MGGGDRWGPADRVRFPGDTIMMTPEQNAFLNRLAECPDDDVARGVYADYLDEIGYPHSAAWQRSGAKMEREEYEECRIARSADNVYDPSGWVACIAERQGLRIAMIGSFSHCSCYDTWDDLCGCGISMSVGYGDMVRPKWAWIGSVEDMLVLARNSADPIVLARVISTADYNAHHLLELYRQILASGVK